MKVDILSSVCYVKIVKEMKKGITENGSVFYFYDGIYIGNCETRSQSQLKM